MTRPRRLTITATQRLGKRLDTVEAQLKGQDTRMAALEQRLRELHQELAETLHVGSYEAMYRLEREENLRLRQHGHWADHDLLLRWIAELDRLCWQLDPSHLPPSANAAVELTNEERRIVEKFGIELSKGLRR